MDCDVALQGERPRPGKRRRGLVQYVALNVFINYFNIAAGVDIDLPKVSHTEVA